MESGCYSPFDTETVTIQEFINKDCGCKLGPESSECIFKFTESQVTECRNSMQERSSDEQDLFVLSFLQLFCEPTYLSKEVNKNLLSFGKP